MTASREDDQRTEKLAYFEMLADMGVTKHIGSLKATKELVRHCHIGESTRVLDVGCGIGLTPCYLARTYGARVTGLDLLPKMIDRARDEARLRGVLDRLMFVVGDAQALPFASGQFDTVLVESVSAFLTDRALGFREYARVTKPGGYVGVTESTWVEPIGQKDEDFMVSVGAEALAKEDWMALMKQTGLALVAAEAYPVDIGEEARGRLERFGCGGMIRLLMRALPVAVLNRNARAVLKRATSSMPNRVFKAMGYGIYVGRKV
ncbi:MAG: class I SAM-dependent methyltransferase [Anaerolineae bacterium]